MRTEYWSTRAAWAALLMVLLVLATACGAAAAPTATPTLTATPIPTATATPTPSPSPTPTPNANIVTVTMLVQAGDDDVQWFRDVEMPKDASAWDLTEKVAGDELAATYYEAFNAHFVDALFGVNNDNPRFWLIFQWNQATGKWEPLTVGADGLSLEDGQVLAWYYADTSSSDGVPTAIP